MQAEVRYAQNAWSSNADTRKPWPPQEGIRWLDAVVRVPDSHAVGAVEAMLNVLHRQDMERLAALTMSASAVCFSNAASR